jgi:hypothetical protein
MKQSSDCAMCRAETNNSRDDYVLECMIHPRIRRTRLVIHLAIALGALFTATTSLHAQSLYAGKTRAQIYSRFGQTPSDEGVLYDLFYHNVDQWGLIGSAVMNFQKDTVSNFIWVSDSLGEKRLDTLANSIRALLARQLGPFEYSDILGVPRWEWTRGALVISLSVNVPLLVYEERGPEDRKTTVARLTRAYKKSLETSDSTADPGKHSGGPK